MIQLTLCELQLAYPTQLHLKKKLTFAQPTDQNTSQSSSIMAVQYNTQRPHRRHTQTYPSCLADEILLPLQLLNLNDHPLQQ
jgi:hypothetical protein